MILTILSLIVGVAGALLLSFGAWMVYPPAGFISGGILCLLWSYLAALAPSKSKGGS